MMRLQSCRKWLASVLVVALSFATPVAVRPASAHEVLPTIADFTASDMQLDLTMSLDIEALIAGVDLSSPTASGDAQEIAAHEALRALPAAEIEARFNAFWPEMAARIDVRADGVRLPPTLQSLTPPDEVAGGLARMFKLNLAYELPQSAQSVTIGWAPEYGPLVLRQNGVTDPYDGYIDPGATSPPIQIAGGGAQSDWATFLRYIPIGFDHIVPKGLDHILFIIGLFLFNVRLRPLLLQISAFTAAHTVTLAAAASNIVTIPASIVEPAIAASIIYIAAENIYSKGKGPFRLPVVFMFGLLHGLGFASVLQEFGLPESSFIPALLGFNLGVEFGQLAVVATAFLLVGLWFNRNRMYRTVVVIPGSAIIGLTGAIWFIQRVS